MRLINISTWELEEFLSSVPPPYAILSHTWGDHEVTLGFPADELTTMFPASRTNSLLWNAP